MEVMAAAEVAHSAWGVELHVLLEAPVKLALQPVQAVEPPECAHGRVKTGTSEEESDLPQPRVHHY